MGPGVAACPSSAILPAHVLVYPVVLAFHSVRLVLVVASGSAYPVLAAGADPSYSVQSPVVAASQSSVDLELPSDVESLAVERRC